MTRSSRTRSRTHTNTGSYVVSIAGQAPQTYRNTNTYTDSCSDWHGRPIADSGFTLDKSVGVSSMSGSVTSSYLGESYVFNNYPYAVSAPTGFDTTPLAAPSGWLLDLVSGTNPSRPVMTPPELLQDLVDLPKQLRALGQLITKPKSLMSPKEVANHYLCVQFGWLPLIEDVKQLLNFQEYAIKRCKELDMLAVRGLRRRIQFGSDVQSGENAYRFSLTGTGYVDMPYDVLITRKSWGTIHWYPNSPGLYHPSHEENLALARRIVSGLTVEGMAKGVWNVLPWTWMLGWFSNVGKYATAHSNTVPASHGNGCFMSSSIRHYVGKPVRASGYKQGSLHVNNRCDFVRIGKTRIVSGSLTPGFNVPFLSTFRLSILGALFTQRAMR